MGEPALKREAPIRHYQDEPSSDTVAKTGGPNLEVLQGGNTTPRGERVQLEAVSAEDAETVTTEDPAETATTENAVQSGDVQEDSAVEIEPVQELEDFPETVTTPTYDLARNTASAGNMSEEIIDEWLNRTANIAKENAIAETAEVDAQWNELLIAEKIIPGSPESREPLDEIETTLPGVEEVIDHLREGVNALLKRQWREVGSRLKKLFGHEDTRRWAGSTVFGVVGAFAITGLTSAMVGDFQSNMQNYLEKSPSAQQFIKNLDK